VDLLAGRAAMRSMHPFMAAELGSLFDLTTALETGMVPLVRAAVDPREALAAYVGLYLREEIQAEGLVRQLRAFGRFLEAISFSHGSVLNVANVSRECEVERTTVEGYLAVLEDLLLAFRIPVFTKRARRQMTTHPKFYLFDAGLFRSLRPSGPLDQPEAIGGAALEGLVAQHLRTWISLRGGSENLYFWRTTDAVEVDFVIYGPGGFWAIEVKNTARVRPDDLAGLRAFGTDYPEAKRILLHRGPHALEIDGIQCLRVDEFLLSLVPELGPGDA
jgi:predicted AAA+ superfamily ATPase